MAKVYFLQRLCSLTLHRGNASLLLAKIVFLFCASRPWACLDRFALSVYTINKPVFWMRSRAHHAEGLKKQKHMLHLRRTTSKYQYNSKKLYTHSNMCRRPGLGPPKYSNMAVTCRLAVCTSYCRCYTTVVGVLLQHDIDLIQSYSLSSSRVRCFLVGGGCCGGR